MRIFQSRWVIGFLSLICVVAAGLILGNWKSGDSVSKMYARHDFSLLDDSGSIFHLSEFPKEKKLLLIFTPDGVPTADVLPFFRFNENLYRLHKMGIEVMLVTRTNREIVRNFKLAAKFSGRILLDPSGTVGKLVGVWPEPTAVSYWAYVLVDSEFRGHWLSTNKTPFNVEEVISKITKSLQKI